MSVETRPDEEMADATRGAPGSDASNSHRAPNLDSRGTELARKSVSDAARMVNSERCPIADPDSPAHREPRS